MNGQAQGALLEVVRVRIVGFATYLGCGSDSEDIAQETLLVLHNRYAAVEDQGEMLKLAVRICANLAMNWRRRKSNSARVAEPPESMADPLGRNPESALIEKQLQELLLKAIRESDERCKELLRLRLGGAKTRDIAELVGAKPGAVDTAYFRCLQRLRNAMGGAR
jgi:RNA polymerase sigma-70 factor (ECF subfamily)